MNSPNLMGEMSSKGLLNMSELHHIAARTLIWLAALTMPVQGISMASCGCCSSESCCASAEQSACCCCSTARSGNGGRCCAGKRLESGRLQRSIPHESGASSCEFCQTGSDRTCGPTCQCGKAQQSAPATPPVESNVAENLAMDLVSSPIVATAYQPQVTRQHDAPSSASDGLAVMDRCVSLCRFTL